MTNEPVDQPPAAPLEPPDPPGPPAVPDVSGTPPDPPPVTTAPVDTPPDAPPVTTAPVVAAPRTRSVRVLSILVMVAGAVLIAAGVVTWFVVRDQLADEKIVVSDDAPFLGGSDVDGPFAAYAEAEAINDHAARPAGA